MAGSPLTPWSASPRPCGPLLLAIMDGVGVGPGDAGDAVAAAATPHLDALRKGSLCCTLRAHGTAVGMPSDADMGNSEVGHNAMGAGRIVDQGAKRVAEAVHSGSLFEGDTWQRLLHRAKTGDAALHFIGLLSDGNVHSHIDHLLAMLQNAAGAAVPRAYVHVLLDGRDVGRQSALPYVERLEACLQAIRAAHGFDYAIASGGGRMQITMDRYGADWPMVGRGWRTHVEGRPGTEDQAPHPCASAAGHIAAMREAQPQLGDQDLPPFVVWRDGRAVAPIRDGDAVVAFNFRGDRMLELVSAFEDPHLDTFARPPPPDVLFAGMTQYDGDTKRPRHFLVDPPRIEQPLSELLCATGVRQWACSETQKFGHVTYFWNGNRSGSFDPQLETYVEIPSGSGPFDADPAMRAAPIAAAAAAALRQGDAAFLRVNFPNGDMVGHTGNFAATVAAVAEVDRCIGVLRDAARQCGGTLVVTGDHGNAEDMLEKDDGGTRRAKTSHSLYPVPLLIEGAPVAAAVAQGQLRWAPPPQPGLANLAATLCPLLGYRAPEFYLPGLLQVA